MFHHSVRQSRAFTLIELLTVIAIMAILSSMLFPSFSRAREMARRSSCSSNMKQLGLAFMQYKDDYDGRYPKGGNWQIWASDGHWVKGTNSQFLENLASPYGYIAGRRANVEGGALFSYTKSAQIYICPSIRNGNEKGLTYSMNCWMSGNSEVAVENSTDIVLLVDENNASDGFFWASTDATSSDNMTQIHNGGGNLLFMDGHVKFYPFARFPAGDNAIEGGAPAAKTRNGTEQPRFFETGVTPACSFS